MADGTRGGSNDAALPLIATDDAGAAGQVQIVKLALSVDGSATPITADAGGLLVNLGANNDVTGPLTDAELRATAVPVSGTVTTGGLTDAQLRAVAVPVSGTVAANAGTNLNTSALALEAGGNLAGAATSLAILDDWDETDRAKVNVIVGQAGIAAGTGVDGVTVPRVTLATNVALPAGANAIGKLAANSGVDIGDVDVLTLPNVTIGTMAALVAGTANIGDVDVLTLPSLVAGSANIGDVDVLTVPADPFGVNADAGSATGSISAKLRFIAGTGIPITGTVTVGSHAVTNAGVFATQVDGAALTALQLIDDPVQVLGTDLYTEAASKGVTLGAVRRDADTTLVNTTNEFAPLQVDALGRLKVEAFSGEALPVTLTSTTITGTVAVTDNAGSITVDAPNGTPVFARITDATLNMGVVDETGASAVDAAAVGGGTPHDSVDSGNPIKVGAKAATAVPSAVAAADRVNIWADLYGRPVVQLGVPVGTERWVTAQYTSTQTGTALLTPTAGKKLIITSVQIQVGGTTAGTVQLWYGGAADTTYSRGTDRAIFDGEFAPSATLKPGFAQTKESGWVAGAADDVLRVTDSAAINPLTITVWGYEV